MVSYHWTVLVPCFTENLYSRLLVESSGVDFIVVSTLKETTLTKLCGYRGCDRRCWLGDDDRPMTFSELALDWNRRMAPTSRRKQIPKGERQDHWLSQHGEMIPVTSTCSIAKKDIIESEYQVAKIFLKWNSEFEKFSRTYDLRTIAFMLCSVGMQRR